VILRILIVFREPISANECRCGKKGPGHAVLELGMIPTVVKTLFFASFVEYFYQLFCFSIAVVAG
jgi:hypothetical protein